MTNRIDIKLAELRAAGRAAVVPWVTVGYPDVETSEALAEAIVNAGGDMLEMGVPFSDPLADGPTIQAASQRALEHGVNIDTALEVLGRGVGSDICPSLPEPPCMETPRRKAGRE